MASVRRASATSSSASVAAASSTASLASAQGAVDVAAPGRGLGPDAAPGDRRLEVGAGERLGLGRDGVGLVDAALQQQRPAEERRGLRGLAVEARDRAALRRRRGAGPRPPRRSPSSSSMKPGGDLGLEQPVGEAELLDRAAGRADHAAGGVDAAAQRLEHGLAAQRDRLDRRARRR